MMISNQSTVEEILKRKRTEVLQPWCFINFKTGERIIIRELDGHRAWQVLARKIGVQQWHGGYEILLPHAWQIKCVCPCGNTQVEKYCSEACYNKAKGGA